MQKILYTPNYTDEDHLEKVKQKMQEYGSPEIEIVETSPNIYVALEGSHRIRAAAELKIPICFIELDPELPCQHDDLIGWEKDSNTNKEMAEGILFIGTSEKFDITNNIPILLADRYENYEE